MFSRGTLSLTLIWQAKPRDALVRTSEEIRHRHVDCTTQHTCIVVPVVNYPISDYVSKLTSVLLERGERHETASLA
jgi:hypothetical protein